MAPKERRFKFRLILFGLFLSIVSGGSLWYIITHPEFLGDSSRAVGTASGLIFIGGILFLFQAIRIKLRQHNLIRW